MGKLTLVEAKLFLRDPLGMFFALALPVILLLTNNSKQPLPDPRALPMLLTLSVGILAFTTLPVYVAEYREKGVLRRLWATPLHPAKLLVAQVVVQFAVAVAALVLLVLTGVVAFGYDLPARPLVFALGFVLGVLAMFALGLVLAAVLPTGKVATTAGIALLLPMLYVSGTNIPRENLPAALRRIGDFTPLSPVVSTLRDTWVGIAPQPLTTGALVVITVAGVAVAAALFRWE